MMPNPTPATSAIGKLYIRATTAPASALSRRLGPNEEPPVNPDDGNTRTAVRTETAPAIAQASDDIWLAEIPAIWAASGLAEAQRIPRPKRLRRRNTANAATAIGPKMSIPI